MRRFPSDNITYCTSGVMMMPPDASIHCSGIIGYGGGPEIKVRPKCDYCGTFAVAEVSSCESCGAPLPWDKAVPVPSEGYTIPHVTGY